MADADLSRSGIAASIGLHGAVGFPVRNGSEFLGVMEFLGRQTNTPDDHVVQMMGCIGGQISQFIERRQAERVLEQQNQDRRTATSIQQALLPSAMPALAGFEIGAKAAFAQDVGGDCFDFVPMTVECQECLAVLVADASGHGMASALLVGEARAYLRALA
jgi:serine phosphatase RsbU (regulator of sigma subunit)